MTSRERIENFAMQIDRPFTIAEAADLCNVNIKNAQKYVKDLKDAGRLKVLRKEANKHLLVWEAPEKSKFVPKYKIIKVEVVRDFINKIARPFTLQDIVENTSCNYWQAKRHVKTLRDSGEIVIHRREGTVSIYKLKTGNSERYRSSKHKIVKAIKDSKEITKKNLMKTTELSLTTVKKYIYNLEQEGFIQLKRIDNHEKVWGNAKL